MIRFNLSSILASSSSLEFGGYSFVGDNSSGISIGDVDFQNSIKGPQLYYFCVTGTDFNIFPERVYEFDNCLHLFKSFNPQKT